MILQIKVMRNGKLILQINQYQINKDNNLENREIVDYDYNVGDKIILRNKASNKYETPYNRPYEIYQTWTKGNFEGD